MRRLLIFVATSLIHYVTAAQTVAINGLVADSATFKPLSGVNLQIKNQLRGTITNEKGYFSLSLNASDSVIFTRVGFQSRTLSVQHILKSPAVYLQEANTMLKEITISSLFEIPGLPKIPPEKIWINPTYKPIYTNTPGLGRLQPFGPSAIFKGVLSRFNKYEKELKKLPKVKKENELARNYLALVNDSLFVNDFTGIYHITKEEYTTFLKLFSEKYGNSVYELPPDELISLLHIFYSENKKHGRTK